MIFQCVLRARSVVGLLCSQVVHRDIAARNVLVGTRPQTHKFIAKISDFGLAKILDDSGVFVTDAKVSQRQYG